MLSVFTNPAILTIAVFVIAIIALNVAEKGRWD